MDPAGTTPGENGFRWGPTPARMGRRDPERFERMMESLAYMEGRPYVPGSSRGLHIDEDQWLQLEAALRIAHHPQPGAERQAIPDTSGSHEVYDPDVNSDEVGSGEEDEDEIRGEPDESGMGAEEAEGEDDGMSDTSSAMYDPEADPDAFARRLDELAGVLEMGEQEARAIRWGVAVDRKDPILSIVDFKALVNHHLNATEWKYTSNKPVSDHAGDARHTGGLDSERHPIWIVGPDRVDEAETRFPGTAGA